jgi:hypothetical protein
MHSKEWIAAQFHKFRGNPENALTTRDAVATVTGSDPTVQNWIEAARMRPDLEGRAPGSSDNAAL